MDACDGCSKKPPGGGQIFCFDCDREIRSERSLPQDACDGCSRKPPGGGQIFCFDCDREIRSERSLPQFDHGNLEDIQKYLEAIKNGDEEAKTHI